MRWNGAPDRYDWKLIGKKEIYIPYNAYKLADKKLKYKEDIIRKNTINSDLMRYELHRVWEVEANLKPGSKHIYGKRVFYLDEDTWTVVYEDAYDTRKQLWRIGVHPMIQFYDVKIPYFRANIWHDLNSGAYYAGGPGQRDQDAVGLEPEGQVGRIPARCAAAPGHEIGRESMGRRCLV